MHNRRLSFDGLRKTRDHYIPVSRGGLDTRENIRMACMRCNTLKSDMMPDAWEQFMRDNMCWWWTDPKKLKWPLATPIVKGRHPARFCKITPRISLAEMTAEENARRMAAYLEHQPTKEQPIPVFTELSRFPKESFFYEKWMKWRESRISHPRS